MFFFGLVNAGVPLGALEAGAWGLPVAALIGKPLGVLVGAGAAGSSACTSRLVSAGAS